MRVMLRATLALGVAMTAAALAPTLATELLVLPAVGVTSMVLLSMATAVCNAKTAPELRGRVMALFSIAFLGSTPIGGPLVGWISEAIDPRAGLAIGALASLVTAALAYLWWRRSTPSVIAVQPTDVALAEAAEAA
jgi:MFS family permease